MALTRKLLEGMGIEERQIETIIEAHTDTVNGLKADRDKYKEQAAIVPELQRRLEEANDALNEADDWKAKYESEKKALKDYQTKIDGERAEAAKAKAYRDMLKSANVDPKRIDAIMRVTDLTKVEMEDGKLKDGDKLAESAKQEWADFIVKTKTDTGSTATPPKKSTTIEGAHERALQIAREYHQRMHGGQEQNAQE